jgi:hypothetical protein
MINKIIVGFTSGILFAVMDGMIYANPIGQQVYEVFKPIARNEINPLPGSIIDLAYGFILVGIFLVLYQSLPGNNGLLKGISYAAILWFFRVVMYSATQWMMFNVGVDTIIYSLAAGLIEMMILGIFIGLTIKIAT